jgi:glycosyltransferase involved in cell wall biosynthesis
MNINNIVSIIVPLYNSENTIIETLESVSNQTIKNFECIVIDDGSTDQSYYIVSNYIKEKENFIIYKKKNKGVASARNFGVKKSKCLYILPLDADDKIENTFLEKCIDCFNKNQALKLVYTEGLLFGEETKLWTLPKYSYKKILHYNMIGNTSMFLREDFNRVGGYRENMVNGLEDWDFWISLLSIYNDDQVFKIEEPLFHYRVSNYSRRLTLHKSKKFDLMLQNIVYNNFEIYSYHYSNIHNRIISHDYNDKMMRKFPVRVLINLLNVINKIKKRFIK